MPRKLCGCVAAAILASAIWTTSASGYTAAIDPAGGIALTSLGALTFAMGVDVECSVTLYGSLSREVRLNEGEVMGSITGAGTSCGPGAVLDLPWDIQYYSYRGSLPNAVTALLVRVVGSAWALTQIVTCLYRGYWEVEIELIGSNPYTTQLVPSLGNELALQSGSFLCSRTMTIEGVLELDPEQEVQISE